jgi:hypothetical protein
MKKQDVVELLDNFPEDVDAEKLIEVLYLKAKLETAEAALDRADVLTQEQVVGQTDRWFQ